MSEFRYPREYSLPLGHVFRAETGETYKVTGFLGRGGQGEVYRVEGPGGEFAVKWYHAKLCMDRFEAFRENLRRNAENGVPKLSSGDSATQFIWPLKMIEAENGSYGYLMKIFPPGYESMNKVLMLRKWDSDTGKLMQLHWDSWFARVTAGLNIVRAFEILHACGMSYQDLNDGGISVNLQNGNVLICDCDNVSPDKSNLGIKGTLLYMAPEVVLNKKRPDRLTDQFSLAVILFRLFLQGHPLQGVESRSLNNSEHITQTEAQMRIYGSAPHYCLASRNNQNPPSPQVNPDVLKLYLTYPMCLMDAFEQVFTEGLEDPSKRLTATEWRKVLLEVRDSLLVVDGQESFYRVRVPKPLPSLARILVYPHGREVLLMPGKVLYKYHFDEYGSDYKTAVAKVILTNKPDAIGLLNESGEPISFSLEGKRAVCQDKGRMPLLKGMELEAGSIKLRVD